MTRSKSIEVAIALVPEFSQLVLTLLTELLRISQMVGDQKFNVRLCSLDGEAVLASDGRVQRVDASLTEIERPNVVAVCASYQPYVHLDSDLLNWLRLQARHASLICGVDTGAIALAEAGILDGRRATLHWEELDFARTRYPKTTFTSTLYEVDGRILTSCGSLATTEFALKLIAIIAGQSVADDVLGLAIHDRNQYQNDTTHPALIKALNLMSENIDKPLSIHQISEELSISPRHLSRLFRSEFATSAVSHYLSLRLDFADRLVRKSRFSLTEIALTSGFNSLSRFSQSYKKHFGASPNAVRRHG